MSEGHWYGNSDHKTSESCYYHSQEYHAKQFAKLLRALTFLARPRVDDRYRPVQLIYTNLNGPNPVVAYRWTSDQAYDKYDHRLLIKHGSSFGRGVWDPFRDQYQMDRYVQQRGAAMS